MSLLECRCHPRLGPPDWQTLTVCCSLVQDVPVEALTTVKPYCNEIHAQAQLWLKRDPKASYEAWKKCLPIRGVPLPSCHSQQPVLPPGHHTYPACHLYLAGVDGNGKSPSKSELHRLYLTEKYVWRWKQFLSRRGKRTTPLDLKLGHNNWLRQVLFTPATQAARQAACTIVEALATVPSRKQQVLDLLTRYHVGWVGTVASPCSRVKTQIRAGRHPEWYITTSTQLQKPAH